MAHSSGGGSSGGGCHSGSSSDGGSSYVYYRHPVPGTRRYSYLDRSGEKQYFYSSSNPADYKLRSLIFPMLFLVLMVLGLPSFHMGYFTPEKLQTPQTEIVIEDGLNVIRNEDRLREDLTRFCQETGVVPAVQTIPQEQWRREYDSLEDYALEEYYALFQDEVHWLIVYSAPEDGSGNPDLTQWSFEGIIGDDADPSVNDFLCSEFTKDTYNRLKTMDPPEKAIGEAFRNLLQIRKPGFYTENHRGVSAFLLCAGQILILLIWPVMELVTFYQSRIKYRGAVLDE